MKITVHLYWVTGDSPVKDDRNSCRPEIGNWGGNREGGPDREIKQELAPQSGNKTGIGPSDGALVAMWPEERAELELELRPIEKADENTKKVPYCF